MNLKKWFSFGKNKRFFGITKMDLEMGFHFKRDGKFEDAEILAQCPICRSLNKESSHRVLYFKCKCGDPFFLHLQSQEGNFEIFPTGKLDVTKGNWNKMFE